MALIKKDNSANVSSAKFESNPDQAVVEQHEQDAAVREVAAPVSAAVANVSPRAVATKSTKLVNVLEDLKNSLVVDYNTLANLQINQGNWLVRESKKMLGDAVDFELLSYQDQWVISPGADGDEAGEFVRYSNDGVTTSQGENCLDYLKRLQDADYPKAAMKQRCILVLNLLAVSKKGNDELLDTLYQVDLPPSSKSKFDAYRAQASFHVARGKKTAEQAVLIRSAVTVVEKNKLSWSVADFTYSDLTQE